MSRRGANYIRENAFDHAFYALTDPAGKVSEEETFVAWDDKSFSACVHLWNELYLAEMERRAAYGGRKGRRWARKARKFRNALTGAER